MAVLCTPMAKADVITPSGGRALTSTAGQALGNVTVATFTDDNPALTASSFTATIDWGDGSTSAGTISGGPTFTVTGNHTYAAGGTFTVTVVIFSQGNGMAVVNDTATIADFAITASPHNFSFTAGVPVTNQTVATFTDGNPLATPASFIATINWGDGSTSTGTISGGPTFMVTGTHTYAAGGTFTVTVTISDVAPGLATTTVTDTASFVSVPVMSFPALAAFALLLALTGWVLARKSAMT